MQSTGVTILTASMIVAVFFITGCLEFGLEYDIRAQIDGHSQLILDNNAARWHHFDSAAPGRHEVDCSDPSTWIPTIINVKEWFPNWPDEPDCENRDCDCDSDTLFKVFPPSRIKSQKT